MSRDAFAKMVAENREWLMAQPRTLERDHIAAILDECVRRTYDDPAALQAATARADAAERERDEVRTANQSLHRRAQQAERVSAVDLPAALRRIADLEAFSQDRHRWVNALRSKLSKAGLSINVDAEMPGVLMLEDELAGLRARLAEVPQLVEAAYREGWVDGHDRGISCGHPLNHCCGGRKKDADEQWEYSTARAALGAGDQPTKGDD